MTPVPAEPRPRRRLGAPLLMVLVMWIVAFADAGTPTQLAQYGIRPRSEDGLVGIVAAPFLHADFAHLIANTGAFIVLGMLVAAVSRRYWPVAAPNTIHIGASGLVYGYAAFLVAWGLVTRRASSILVAVLVVLLYGGLVFGVLPTQQGISWQGHLFGAIGGVVMALVLSPRRQPARRL
jgi:membrane associated rhomboid family serine protease